MRCKYHPERAGRRRCHACRQPVCGACVRHADRREFCSGICHLAWKAEQEPRAPRARRLSRKAKKRARRGQQAALAQAVLQAKALQALWLQAQETAHSLQAAAPPEPVPLVERAPPGEAARRVEPAAPAESASPAASAFTAEPASPATPASPLEPGIPLEAAPRRPAPIVLHKAAPRGSRFAALVAAQALILAGAAGILWLGNARLEDAAGRLARDTELRHPAPPETPFLLDPPHEFSAPTLTVAMQADADARVTVLVDGIPHAVTAATVPPVLTLTLDAGPHVLQPVAERRGLTAYGPAVLVRRTAPKPSRAPAPPLPAKKGIDRVPAAGRAVSFTFDGGSSANAAAAILSALRERGITTTLFLTGEFIRRYPEMVLRALDDGHEVGNHTWNHPHLTTFDANRRHDNRPHVDRSFVREQLERTEAEYRKLTGRPMAPLWRAPYGEVNAVIEGWATELGYRHVGWTRDTGLGTLDSLDWVTDEDSRLYLSGPAFERRLIELARTRPDDLGGGIFLMHLGTERKEDQLHTHLPRILDVYHAEGFRIVPVSHLIAATAAPDIARRAD